MYFHRSENPVLVLTLLPLLLSSTLASSSRANQIPGVDKPTAECPTWFVPQSHNGNEFCVCGNPVSGKQTTVLCDQTSNKTLLLLGNCMTFDKSSNHTFVGGCSYNNHEADVDMLYTELPKDVSQLNTFMCEAGGLNRTGLLCGKCMEGLGPAVFSYKLECLSCLKIRMDGYCTYSLRHFPQQCSFYSLYSFKFESIQLQWMPSYFCVKRRIHSQFWTLFLPQYLPFGCSQALHRSTPHRVWNLEPGFLRYVLPPFCIGSPIKSSLHVLSLEYIVAIYPLVLISTTYVCIELHDRDCRILVHLSGPLRWCTAHFRRNYNPKESIIHAFSAFLLLSYSKIVFVCFTLLSPTVVYSNSGSKPFLAAYSDASIPFFGSEHLPFALLAIFVLLTFVALPLLVLLLYPTRLLQRLLACCGMRWYALRAFADDFQGFYKGGINGTCDYRYFAGLYLIFRIVWISSSLINGTSYTWLIRVLFPITASLLFALMRPYKKRCFNILDSVTFALLALIQFWIMYDKFVGNVFLQIAYALGVLPLVYITILMGYKILVKIRHRSYRIEKMVAYAQTITLPEDTEENKRNSFSIPDRLTNPEDYESLA